MINTEGDNNNPFT